MSWHYSRALVEAYLEAKSLNGRPCAPLNASPTPQAYLCSDRMTDFFPLSQFGMTFAPLTDDLGATVLTWYLADFPARTSAQQGKELESKETKADSGWKWHESSVKYDHDMRLWKTRQYSLLGDSEWFSETWPRWGILRDGECWELPMSARPTFERGYGLWQTPVADDSVERTNGKINSRGEPKLSAQVKWPTPRANDAEKRGDFDMNNPRNGLAAEVKKWPTPRAFMHKDATTDRGKGNLGEVVGGQLNPTWVAWLMGWPLGWTDLKPLETDKYLQWLHSHGRS